jgi:hypothetical protein
MGMVGRGGAGPARGDESVAEGEGRGASWCTMTICMYSPASEPRTRAKAKSLTQVPCVPMRVKESGTASLG